MQRYSGARKKKSRMYYNKILEDGVKPRDFAFASFPKRENMFAAITKKTFSPIRPRAVSACSEKVKPLLGPVMYVLSKIFSLCFCATYVLFYASGATADDLNRHYTRSAGPHTWYLTADYSKYDASQGQGPWDAWVLLCEYLSISKMMWFSMYVKYSITYALVYASYFMYWVFYTQKSGSCETTVSNSYFALLVFLYTLYELCERNFELFVKMLLILRAAILSFMGDDSLVELDDRVISPLAFQARYHDVAYRAGLNLTSHLSLNPTDSDFLNKRLYVTKLGIAVGMKPGRYITKAGLILQKGALRNIKSQVQILYSNLYAAGPTGNHVPFLRKYRIILMEYIEVAYPGTVRTAPMNQYKYLEGKIHECDSLTWKHFTDVYKLDEADEESFSSYLRKSVYYYGLHCVLDHYAVDRLVEVDSA
jgi:hypothetical protein